MGFGKINKEKWNSKVLRWVFVALLLMTIVAGWLLLSDVITNYRRERLWKEVRNLREAGFETGSGSDTDKGKILPEYKALYEKNNDMTGWLTIDWCKIDYPVMQTKDDPEHYLRLNFDKEFDGQGTPFIDYRCGVMPRRSFNVILYGHYSNADSCFRRLLEYAYENRMLEHREFRFDTLSETGIYEVEAAFYYDATDSALNTPDDNTGELAYEFYNYIELDSEEGFGQFLDGIRERTLYSWEPEITPEDKLLTIVCCAPEGYSDIESGGRFVVISKKK